MTRVAQSLLLSCLLYPVLSTANPSPETWNQLPETDKVLWREVVTNIFPGDLTAEQNYEFHHELARQGRTDLGAYDHRFLELALAQQLTINDLQNQIDQPSTATLEAFVAEVPQLFPTVDRINLLNIHLRKFDGETTDSLNQRVDTVEAQLKQGVPFGEVAYKHSDARSAAFRGVTGTISRGTLAPEIDNIVFHLEPGKYAGPFETRNGINFFQVDKVLPATDLSRPADFERAVRLWEQRELGSKYESITAPWKLRDDLSITTTPLNHTNWLNDPWIVSDDGQVSESLGLLYVMTRHGDPAIHEPGEWNAFWEDEAGVQWVTVLSYLACFEAHKNDSHLSRSLELARIPYEATQYLRNWQAELKPTEADLRNLYETEKEQLAPERTLYTYTELRIPLPVARDSDAEARREALGELLNSVYDAMKGKQADSRDQAVQLLNDLQSTFPQSRLINIDSLQSEDPLIDPVLARTEIGSFSRPFDHGNSVSVLYMEDKETTRTSFEDAKSYLEEAWRTNEGQKRVKEIRARIGVN